MGAGSFRTFWHSASRSANVPMFGKHKRVPSSFLPITTDNNEYRLLGPPPLRPNERNEGNDMRSRERWTARALQVRFAGRTSEDAGERFLDLYPGPENLT